MDEIKNDETVVEPSNEVIINIDETVTEEPSVDEPTPSEDEPSVA